MKIVLALLIIQINIHATSLIKCLGNEEEYYAKQKHTGPNYRLNQMMIEKIANLSQLKLTPLAFKKICKNGSITPSIKLLEMLLSKKTKLFKTNFKKTSLEYQMLKELRHRSPDLLVTYMSYIQTIAATPDCLERYIPHTKEIYARYRYLEDVVDKSDFIESQKELNAIFKELKNIDGILVKCKQDKIKALKKK